MSGGLELQLHGWGQGQKGEYMSGRRTRAAEAQGWAKGQRGESTH